MLPKQLLKCWREFHIKNSSLEGGWEGDSLFIIVFTKENILRKDMWNPFEQPIGVDISKKTKIDISLLLERTCILKKDTILFRVSKTINYYNEMFFSFQIDGVTSACSYTGSDSVIQIWKTIKDIEIPYRIIDINNGFINGSLETIYHYYFKKWEFAYDFKKFSNPNRVAFLNFLKERGDIGWVSSVEDKNCAELFLMNSVDDKKKVIKFQAIVKSQKDYSTLDSFTRVIFNE